MEALTETPLQYTYTLGETSRPLSKVEKYYKTIMVKGYGGKSYPYYFKIAYLNSHTRLLDSNEYRVSRNKAVAKIEDKLAIIENLFEAIYERRQAYDMLIGAAKGILKFLKNRRKPKYWKSLKAGAKPKDLPSAFLAYNFGLMPLIGSIKSACDLLGSEFPVYMVRGASGGSKTTVLDKTDYSDSKLQREVTEDWMIEFRTYVKPKVNPNAALLNVMGITSPLSTLFSVVPWGWAVNYFVNVSEVLSNFDNKFPGIEIVSTWETSFVKGRWWHESWFKYQPELSYYQSGEYVRLERKVSKLNYLLTHSFPPIGSNQAAYLLSAIAVSMK